MITRLFETFDPLIRTINLRLLRIIIPTIFPAFYSHTLTQSRNTTRLIKIQKFLFRELRASLRNLNNTKKTLILFSIFFVILTINIAGLIPYVFTITRQMLFTLRISLPIWLAFILFSATYNTNHFISHIVPLSTPLPLSQFIVLIETISLVIRPITLSVRLCANITAGHILIALVRKPIFIFNLFSLVLLLLLILEIAVAFIQRYVFSILLSIYLRETN